MHVVRNIVWSTKGRGAGMTKIVTYEVDEQTEVRFEVDPTDEWREVSADQVLGRIAEAVQPAVDGARVVLEKVKESAPAQVEIKFGVKVSGTANWFVARAATEGNFEITLTWKRSD
jgi:hypothetical protein